MGDIIRDVQQLKAFSRITSPIAHIIGLIYNGCSKYLLVLSKIGHSFGTFTEPLVGVVHSRYELISYLTENGQSIHKTHHSPPTAINRIQVVPCFAIEAGPDSYTKPGFRGPASEAQRYDRTSG